jgi:Regulator of ribonuclease activity B
MSHNYEQQRRDTYASFKNIQGVKLPATAVVEFIFFIEELDANWAALEKALRAEGFHTRREADGETLIASFGPMPVTPEAIWLQERAATTLALKHDFYPDGWELAD